MKVHDKCWRERPQRVGPRRQNAIDSRMIFEDRRETVFHNHADPQIRTGLLQNL
jgi:hypothetical protein